MVYFKFTAKRSTFDVIDLVFSRDMIRLLPNYLLDFWYVLFIWVAFVYLLKKLYEKTEPTPSTAEKNKSIKHFFFRLGWFITGAALTLIGFRGGLQRTPIYIGSAAEYTSVQNIPLVLNTPFTIMKSAELLSLKEINYMSDGEVKKIFNPIHAYKSGSAFQKKNVVIIILESFAKEYVGFYNHGNGYTPFLDSLMGKSLVFNRAYANSKRSIEALPAITASVPTLMSDPFSISRYGTNNFESLPKLLGAEGYATAFYHGGINGTMNFNDFCNISGFQNYYGKNQYPDQNDYDDSWGIWDEPYFQYFANELTDESQPFFATIFSLSSHHPYAVPDKYKGKFKEGPLPIHISISYSDFALRKFFETASQKSWFNNTLFVFTADHTSLSDDPYYKNPLGLSAIPIFFYDPSATSDPKIDQTVMQQIDIMPSVLHLLNYPKTFYSFGNDVFDTTAHHFAINYSDNSIYQFITHKYLIQSDGIKNVAVYDITTDSLLTKSIASNMTVELESATTLMKAVIQTYNHDVINNKMSVQTPIPKYVEKK